MAHKTHGILVSDTQLNRIEEYPFGINLTDENAVKNLMMDDNLEMGILMIKECPKGILSLQRLITDFNELSYAELVAKITISALWQQETVMIHNINCKHGYEYLALPMIEHVVNFAKFYEYYQSVWISARKKEKWFNYASGILSNFQKKGNAFICQIR